MTVLEEINLMTNEDIQIYQNNKKNEKLQKINEKNKRILMYKSYIQDYIKFDGIYGKNNLLTLKKQKNSVDISGLMLYTMVRCDEKLDDIIADDIAQYILDCDYQEFSIFINNLH